MKLSDATDDPVVIDTDEDAVTLSRSTYPVGDFLTVSVGGEPAAVLRLDDGSLSGDGYVAEVDPEAGLLELVDTDPEEGPRRTLVSLAGDRDSDADVGSLDGERVASGTPERDPARDGATAEAVERLSAVPTADFGSVAVWEDATVECLEFQEGTGEESVGSRLGATTRSVRRVVVSGGACVIDDPETGARLLETDRLVDVRFDDPASEELEVAGGEAPRGVEAGVASDTRRGAGGTDRLP